MDQGPAIRQARSDLNMTQAHLAALAGVSEKTVRRAEAGDAIRPDSVRALCAALKLDATELRSRGQDAPDDGLWGEALVSRQIWASRVAIVCLGLGCVLGPTARYLITGPWALGFRVALVLLGTTIMAAYALGFACVLVPALRRRLLATAASRWMGAKREQVFLAAMIGVCTFSLCLLPACVVAFLREPLAITGFNMAACLFSAIWTGAVVTWLVTLKDIVLPPRAADWAGVGITATDAGPLEGVGRMIRPAAAQAFASAEASPSRL